MAEIEYCDLTPRKSDWSTRSWYEPESETPSHGVSQGEVDEWIIDVDKKWYPKDLDRGQSQTPTELFEIYAAEWEREVAHLSSVTDIITNANYQKIIKLGWPIVPKLLTDLQEKHRFWYPALDAITGIRPFDVRDAGKAKIMTDAWIIWGKRKGLI